MASSSKSAQAFRTISEVATELDLPQHVLRFWETKFNAIKPMKRGGGRRYYRPDDIVLLQRIRGLLYGDGYTIKGVQKLLREGGGKIDLPEGKGKVGEAIQNTSPETISTEPEKAELKSIMAEL
ncbi:MAG TPA: MerR family transcriptional regulator, partial [Rhodospirillales bacterium]|nr:MerR family transcriptional regulator [Rhodospirillales bacterium]